MALMEIIQWIGQLFWFSLGGCRATGDYEIFKGMDSFKCFWLAHRNAKAVYRYCRKQMLKAME